MAESDEVKAKPQPPEKKVWCQQCNKSVKPGKVQGLCSVCNHRILCGTVPDHPLSQVAHGANNSQAKVADVTDPAQEHTEDFSSPIHDVCIPQPEDKYMTLHFHVIIPAKIWKLYDNSSVRIRFCHSQLGDLKTDKVQLWPSDNLSKADGQLQHWDGQFPVALQCLKDVQSLMYKYVVYSQVATECRTPLERLCFESVEVLRCLKISRLPISHRGVYHQYDTMAYPSLPKPKPLDEDQFYQTSLLVHLEKSKEELTSGDYPVEWKVYDKSKEIVHIYKCIRDRAVGYITKREWYQLHKLFSATEQKTESRYKQVTDKAMKEWLTSVITGLKQNQVMEKLKKLMSAFTLALILYELDQDKTAPLPYYNYHHIRTLVQMLALEVDLQGKQCPGYNFIHASLGQQLARMKVSCAVRNLCLLQFKNEGISEPAWLYALPYSHFMSMTCNPFHKPKCTWDFQQFKMAKAEQGKEVALQKFQQMKSDGLFEADPTILYLFLYICPKEAYVDLIEHIPLNTATEWLQHIMNGGPNGKVTDLHLSLLREITKLASQSDQSWPCDPNSFLKASLSLLSRVMPKVLTSKPKHLEMLQGSIMLVYLAISKACGEAQSTVASDKATEQIALCIRKWIGSEVEVGGTVFGGRSFHLKKEYDLWKSMIETEDRSVQSVANAYGWKDLIKEILHNRVTALTVDKRIELLSLVAQDESILDDVITDAAVQVIPNLAKQEKGSQTLHRNLRKVKTKRIGEVLGVLFKREWGQETIQVTLPQLLQWEYWPWFLEICATKSDEYQGFPTTCQASCNSATQEFVKACHLIVQRKITKGEFRAIQENKVRMDELLQATASVLSHDNLTVREMQEAIEEQQKKIDSFESWKNHIRYFCDSTDIDVAGLNTLKQLKETDFESTLICDLIEPTSDQFLSGCFEIAEPLRPILKKFYTLRTDTKCATDFFTRAWYDNLKNAAANKSKDEPFTFEGVVEKVWKPACEHCNAVFKQLDDRSIKLTDVHEYFGEYERAERVSILRKLAMMQCKGQECANAQVWAELAVIMNQYLYTDYEDAAKAFLDQQKVWKPACEHCNPDFKQLDDRSIKLTDVDEYSKRAERVSILRKLAMTQCKGQECANAQVWAEGLAVIMNQYLYTGYEDAAKAFLDLQKVWKPACEHCNPVFKQLDDRSIKLTDVDEYSKRAEQVSILRKLAMMQCKGQECTNAQVWAEELAVIMNQYFYIAVYGDAAKAFLDLQKSFELRGDFTTVEKLHYVVTTSRESSTLKDIRPDVIEVGDFLQEVTKTKATLECLHVMANCTSILKWIHEICDDVSDLQNFVNVALDTGAGGEDALTRDRLSDLGTVGSGFASLIFGLQPEADFQSLVKCCRPIWDVLEHTPRLPKLLDSCNTCLEWYKQVKGAQGSVEATTMGQMRDILDYGYYTIGYQEITTPRSIQDVVKVELAEANLQLTEANLPKRVYTLDKLQDLESRLVLIKREGSADEKEAELFLNVLSYVRRIAEVIISLQQAGKVEYIGWTLQFHCKKLRSSTHEHESGLLDLANHLDNELDVWQHEVDEARENFYELNYFTTKQLLDLRYELGRMKGNVQHLLSPHIINLLQSTSPELSNTEVLNPEIFRAIASLDPNYQDSEGSMRISCDSIATFTECKSDDATTHVSLISTTPSTAGVDFSNFSGTKLEMFTELLECGFAKELAEKAVEMFEDLYDAVEWCTNNESENIVADPSCALVPTMDESYTLPEEASLITAATPFYTTSFAGKEAQRHEGTTKKANEKRTKTGHSNAKDLEICREIFDIKNGDNAEKVYLSLHELGKALHYLARLPGQVCSQRPFDSRRGLKISAPNLIVSRPDIVLKVALSLYCAEELHLPLPTPEEVVVCNENTTVEEVILLWRRAFKDPGFRRIFCLLHAEKLTYQTADKVVQSLTQMMKTKDGYRLVIICSSEEEAKSHIISKLNLYRRSYKCACSDEYFRRYLKSHFQWRTQAYLQASQADKDRSSVRVISSTRSGMGKSLYIRRMSEILGGLKFSRQTISGQTIATIPIHGPDVSPSTIMDLFAKYLVDPLSIIFHLDIAPSVFNEISSILFSILILRGLSDTQGRVWRVHPSQLYAVEVTLPEDLKKDESMKQVISSTYSLIDILPKVECISPKEVLLMKLLKTENTTGKNQVSIDEREFQTPAYQRVYQYLKRYERGEKLDDFIFQSTVEDSPLEWLQACHKYCGIPNPSWSEIRHFVQFLNAQLHSCEHDVKDEIPGLRTFMLKFLIRMSKDFATSSLRGEEARDEGKADTGDKIDQLTVDPRHQWEQRPHPYIFFNKDRITATFVGFTVTSDGDLKDPRTDEVLEKNIVQNKDLLAILHNRGFSEDYLAWESKDILPKLTSFMGIGRFNPDESYVLTVDNFVKILGIQMRFRCGIPVVIMGETGCGKTRLIRYMCDMAARRQACDISSTNMLILKVHGGTTEEDIVRKVNQAITRAKENRKNNLKGDVVIFFDEANTTEAIGLIKEIMCDRRVKGVRIQENIKFIAACNPYRKHTPQMIRNLESAGLGFYLKETETHHKLGNIPLRQLVYRVLDLPPSMRPLVYDFGQLSDDTELQYTRQIVNNHVRDILQPEEIEVVASVMAESQKYMKMRKDECSFVSLRDVERTMIVFKYFNKRMPEIFSPLLNERAFREKEASVCRCCDVTRALVLALSVCYHARLQDRSNYEKTIVQKFRSPLELHGGVKHFQDEIRWVQEVLLDNMKVGENIAKNAALRENVFMMTISIELRIPLFLVGKPGSSKSLAKTIVASSMEGQASANPFLRNFKRVHMLSYQCSKYSTPESVVAVFGVAKVFQNKQDPSKYVSVVVLDEIGLAEDSPSLPLKALHPLLEDGTAGGDDEQQIIERDKRVAFIGISNWALDPAKMNRGVMVTRGDPDIKELVHSAEGICSTQQNDPVEQRLKPLFEPLSLSYIEIKKCEDREFFGLRDFYSLIKMLYWLCKKSHQSPNQKQLEHVIRRNFGGSDKMDVMEIFQKNLSKLSGPDLSISPELYRYANPDCTPSGLLEASLTDEEGWENRYLLLLTENFAALQSLQYFLDIPKSTSQDPLSIEDKTQLMEPFILFGSSFPKDREYTQTCRNINQIKLCMETGRTVILLNLENLYESLYDVLNQYYLHHGGKRYVDLGLQVHRVKCQVHPNFRLILIAERRTVYDKFPTPLINRLEKHFVLSKTLLNISQLEVLNNLEEWIEAFTTVNETKQEREQTFKPSDAFVGYQSDTPAAVVFQASKFIWCGEQSDEWKAKVLMESKRLLLETASPDALIRLSSTPLAHGEQRRLYEIYFYEQHHSSVEDFLKHQLTKQYDSSQGILMQVTTHSHLLGNVQIEELEQNLSINVYPFILQEFDTEEDFSAKISAAFDISESDSLLLIQCDSGHLFGDLIACARYRVYDKQAKVLQEQRKKNGLQEQSCTKKGKTHVLFVIHLPRKAPGSSFVGFQGDPWICSHLDELLPDEESISLHHALMHPISELFYHQTFVSQMVMPCSTEESYTAEEATILARESYKDNPNQCQRLRSCVQAAASKLYDSADNQQRTIERIGLLLQLIPKPKSTDFPLNDCTFYGALVKHILRLLQEQEKQEKYDGETQGYKTWVLDEALSTKKLQHGGTFRNALGRKMDQILVPILAEIIAFIDCNCNLELLRFPIASSAVYKLWIKLFQNNEVCQLQYRDEVPGTGNRRSEANYQCQFPFSWIVKSTVDEEWQYINRAEGESDENLHQTLCSSLSKSAVGQIFEEIELSEVDKLAKNYLTDFVRSVHKCAHNTPEVTEMEYELVQRALAGICTHFQNSDNSDSLLHRIVSVHIVYDKLKSEILWFGELLSFMPGIAHALMKKVTDCSMEMVLHIHAVNEVLCSKALDISNALKRGGKAISAWLQKVYEAQVAVNATLSLPTTSDVAHGNRRKWKLMCALKIFTEHVLVQELQLVPYARRLDMLLQRDCDFTKVEAFDRVLKVLTGVENGLRKLVIQDDKQKRLRENCSFFFVEVITNFCFGAHKPEDNLIALLIEGVFSALKDQSGLEKHSFLYKAFPSIHLCLLRLLLRHNVPEMKPHLESYFIHFQEFVAGDGVDSSVYLQLIQCCEDYFYGQLSKITYEQKSDAAAKLLTDGYEVCSVTHKTIQTKADFTSEFILGIGKIRASLVFLAHLLCNSVSQKYRQPENPLECSDLLEVSHRVIADTEFNGKEHGAATFLIKVIVQQYGYIYLIRITQDVSLTKLIPQYLHPHDQEVLLIDPHVIYNPKYAQLRDVITEALFSQSFDELDDGTKGLTEFDAIPLLLVFFEKVTLSWASINDDVVQGFETFTTRCKALSRPQLQMMAQALVTNSLGSPMKVEDELPAQKRILTGLVVHAAAVFFLKDIPLLKFFRLLLLDPDALRDSYFPAMPGSIIAAEQAEIGARLYRCVNGHKFFAKLKNQTPSVVSCSQCGAAVDANKTIRNTTTASSPATQIGYVLGSANTRSILPLAERNLSAFSCVIIRILLHAALVWSSCNNKTKFIAIADLLRIDHTSQLPTTFCWAQLECDLQLLSKVLGKSADEAGLLVHVVLYDILNKSSPRDVTEAVASVQSPEDRIMWETMFDGVYIQPILKDMEERLHNAVMKNDKKEHKKIFRAVYEKDPPRKAIHHLWKYQSQMTADHLPLFPPLRDVKCKYPVLHRFIEQEPSLRATRYIPDVLHLQQCLYYKFHHRIDARKAATTIKEFLKDIETSCAEHVHRRYKEIIISLQKALELVREKLRDYARDYLLLEEKYIKYMLSSVDDDTPLEYLIPTADGRGACTTALVKYLVLVHNDFIQTCQKITEDRQGRKSFWKVRQIPLAHVRQCHLLEYHDEIIPVVLSHCHYLPSAEQGKQIECNLAVLEKHILDKFIHGRPLIVADVPQVTYRKATPISTAAILTSVRKHVLQKELPLQARNDILRELNEVYRLNETLERVTIVMGFLISSGRRPDTPLRKFLKDTLQLDLNHNPISSKACEYCNLEHIISLWRLLSAELARQHTLMDQEPFDNIPEDFLDTFEPQEQQKIDFEQNLADIDADHLLEVLYEFTETYIKSSPKADSKDCLVEKLEAYMKENGLPPIPRFKDDFPKYITLGQVVSVWKYIVKH